VIETFTQHRRLLFSVAYRMLGRVAEAEDVVQETWLRWQKQDAADVRSAKAWLVSAVTRLCIDHLRSAQRQREEYYGVWLPEPLVDDRAESPQDAATLADSVTMAFMMMLDALKPVERAVFLLRHVFDYDYADIAAIVGKSEAHCRQIVRRAKASLPTTPLSPAPVNERAQRTVEQFFAATATGDVRELLALLTDNAVLFTDGGGRVASAGRPIRTADHISRFFAGLSRRGARPAVSLTRVNGTVGAIVRTAGRLDRVVSFDLDESGTRIRAIYIVRNPDKLRHVAPVDPRSVPNAS
jgi:RNA polymerase sigma-70 factor (ECF subfamily)